MKPRSLALAAVASSFAVLAACGGASESELFAAPGSSEFGTLPTGGGDTEDPGSSSGGSSGLSGSGSSSSSSSSSGASGSTSGGTSGTSGGTADAGAADAGWKSAGIWCGKDDDDDDVYCAAGQACCAKSGGGKASLTCTAGGPFVSCQGGLAIRCDDQTDCPSGQVCCGKFEENSGYQSVQCSTTCNSVAGVIRAVRFCDPDAPADECASIGKTCGWSQALPGYSICK